MTHMTPTTTFTSLVIGCLIFSLMVWFVRGLIQMSEAKALPAPAPSAPEPTSELIVVPEDGKTEAMEDDEARLKRESRSALKLRLARLFAKIDPEMTYEPYRQLDRKRAEARAVAILDAVNSFLMAGYFIGTLRSTHPITEANPLLKNRITGLLYVGLRQQVNHLLTDELEKLVDDPVFVKEAFDLYDEIQTIPNRARIRADTEDYFEIYETHV